MRQILTGLLAVRSVTLAASVLNTVLVAARYLAAARVLWRPRSGRLTCALCASYVDAANRGLLVSAYILG